MQDHTDLLRGLIARAFHGLSDDTRRAQGLLRDAMPKVVGSFRELQTRVEEQVKLITEVSAALGSSDTGGFIGGMKVIIDTFVKDLISVSRQSMRVVERVDAMSGEVDGMVRDAGKLENMAAATRIVALNAQVEANRTRAGQVFRVVADETKQLAREADQFSADIRGAVDRVRERLNETQNIVGDLASHDMTIALTTQANLARTVETIDAANAELLVTLRALQAQVDAAMTALQFDDILTQLLASIDRRILLLEEVWLDSIAGSLAPEQTQHMLAAWERRHAGLNERQAVQQTTLDAGAAELF